MQRSLLLVVCGSLGYSLIAYIPANTRHRFNVYKTSILRLIDVETTSCVYWDEGRNRRLIDEVNVKLPLKQSFAKNEVWQLGLLGSIITVHFNGEWSSETTSNFNVRNLSIDHDIYLEIIVSKFWPTFKQCILTWGMTFRTNFFTLRQCFMKTYPEYLQIIKYIHSERSPSPYFFSVSVKNGLFPS